MARLAETGGEGLTVDYTTKPYAQWLEDVLPELIELDPVSIGFVMLLPDGTSGTAYFNCDTTDMKLMATAIEDDRQLEWIKSNADIVADILSGEDGDEDGLQDPNTETDSEG